MEAPSGLCASCRYVVPELMKYTATPWDVSYFLWPTRQARRELDQSSSRGVMRPLRTRTRNVIAYSHHAEAISARGIRSSCACPWLSPYYPSLDRHDEESRRGHN